MAFISRKERLGILTGIKDFLNDIDITTEIIDTQDENDPPLLLAFMETSDESVWAGEELPDDPHAASIQVIQFAKENDADEDVFTKYLLLYFEVIVSLEGVDEISVLKLINDVNSSIPIGHFFYSQESGDSSPAVHFKATIGADTDEEFDEGVIGETIITMGIIYDDMKEKLLELVKQ